MTITCPTCGQTYQPSRSAIRAGTWKACPHCAGVAPETVTTTPCEGCGRPLRDVTRTLCLRCLGLSA